MTSDAGPPPQSVLADTVRERIQTAIPSSGGKIVGCLDTAAYLIQQALTLATDLRLPESVAYNIREALDAVVVGQQAAPGGVPAVADAWARYQTELQEPDADVDTARARFDETISRVVDNQARSSWRAHQLLEYLRTMTGVDPLLPGDLDPISEYSRIREQANGALHNQCELNEVVELFDRATTWFVRMFTPPDAQLQALVDLALRPYEEPSQIEELRRLVTNPHHLRLFLERVTDPAWLDVLYEHRLIQTPQPGTLWPVAGVMNGLGVTAPDQVAKLLDRVLDETKDLAKEQQAVIRYELLRLAWRLGAAGYQIAERIIKRHQGESWVLAIGTAIVRDADPSDPIVKQITDALLVAADRVDDSYRVTVLLEHLRDGLTRENVAERIQMVAAKMRRLARDPRAKFVVLDLAALTTDLDDERETMVMLAHYLTHMAVRARELGVSTNELLNWMTSKPIPGQIGERIVSQLLAGAIDAPLGDKITHIAVRLNSSVATGDDLALVQDIISLSPAPELLEIWATTLGEPSPAPQETAETTGFPDDWARAWRWSAVLPAETLVRWWDAIAVITARHGEPSITAMKNRFRYVSSGERSPYSEQQLSALTPTEAAALVSRWRPDENGSWVGPSTDGLAMTLAAVVKADLVKWTEDPSEIVSVLREPRYLLSYLRTLNEGAGELADRASAIFRAARMAQAARWEPTRLGGDAFDAETQWSGVDVAVVDLIAALANNNGDIAGDLDGAWDAALEMTRELSFAGASDASVVDDKILATAINRRHGRGLEAVLALASWEFRNLEAVRSSFEELLDEVLRRPGRAGMEQRAILMTRRPFLEAVVPAWFERCADALFRDKAMGRMTFDLTLKWARPTLPFLIRFQPELFDAARRGAEHAVNYLLVGLLNQEDGYGAADLIDGLRKNVSALSTMAAETAWLVQSIEADAPQLTAAVEFWRALLDSDRQKVPTTALHALGRWAFVTTVDESTWMTLMEETLRLTEGEIDHSIYIADRCKAAKPEGIVLSMLLRLLGKGEPWERDHIERAAVDTLRLAAQRPVDQIFWSLRTRLIELGQHEAAEITPDDSTEDCGES
ncbi:hypothetical protein [Streptosporangium subroseum]|uniref:hypothetical protein n=1 Tax=Streptosporangium subroseum TaxID=106412 RepID=UPI00308DFBC9|nr:hypothetical protein OHB15_11280 [Streptosporangium subroseum]